MFFFSPFCWIKQVVRRPYFSHRNWLEKSKDVQLNFSTLFLQDTFSMAVSFLSGKVVYVSPQGPSLLRCKPECLQGTVFSDLLAPQDVSTFYSGTAPCRLPTWASCIGSGELRQTKIFFWRIDFVWDCIEESYLQAVKTQEHVIWNDCSMSDNLLIFLKVRTNPVRKMCSLRWMSLYDDYPVLTFSPTLFLPSFSSSRLHSGEVHVLSNQCQPDAGRRDALLPLSPHTLPAHHQRLRCCWATALLPAHRREGPLWIRGYLSFYCICIKVPISPRFISILVLEVKMAKTELPLISCVI